MKQVDRIREMERCLDISDDAVKRLSEALDFYETNQKAIKKLFELFSVLVYLLHCHHRARVGAAGGVSEHGGASSNEDDRSVTVFLHVHHYDDLHEVPYVKAVRSCVETYIKLDFFASEKLSDAFIVCGLFDKTALSENIVHIVEL